MGAWFEAKIVALSMDNSTEPPSLLYDVLYEGYVKFVYKKVLSFHFTQQKNEDKYRNQLNCVLSGIS